MLGKSKSGNTKKTQKTHASTQSKANFPGQLPITPDEQQQNKIILYFANDQKIDAVPDGYAEATPIQREKVISDLKSGKITSNNIKDFLLQVVMPVDDHKSTQNNIFQELSRGPKQKQIFSVLTGHNASNWQNVNATDLNLLLNKPVKGHPDYRTPVGFAVFRQKFLDGIKAQATPEQFTTYLHAMNSLAKILYGRRYEYYQQILLLSDQAESQPTSSEAQPITPPAEAYPKDTTTPAEIKPESTSPAKTAPRIQSPTQITPLSQERSTEILSRAIISGDPWHQDGNEYPLTTASLTSSGLTPAFETFVDAVSISLSYPFQLSDGRGAALAFVDTPEGAKVRSYYLDTKTGLWHYAPDIIRGARGEGMSQITEGYGPASTMLPALLQKSLCELVKTYGFREITNVNPDFLFAGTAKSYNSMQEYREALSRGQNLNDFYHEVDSQPMFSNWQPSGKNKNVPQLISVNANICPNFQAPLTAFLTYSILAGQLSVNTFPSSDGQFIWIFESDDWNRTHIAGLETTSLLTSTGCHTSWTSAGDLTTPLYENTTKSGNYGDPADTRKGLIGMWNQYLSKIPLIQQFLAWKNSQSQ